MKRFRYGSSGFTLIEILIVVIIIAILATIVIPRLVGRTEKAKRTKAISDVKNLETALDLFEADNGFFPTTDQGLRALVVKPTTEPTPEKWRGPYLKKTNFTDPWGRAYNYLCPGEHNEESYDLSCYGKDGQPGGEGVDADIVNWEEETPQATPTPGD
ncbi:MAG: type II secretion system major pseudopilin GspG [Armatimonadetes bacterium]|nr:type II secretion system major pseudopilin GspG [Armatimonadota bacterium]